MAEGTVHEGKIRRVKRILYPLVKIIAYAGSSAEGYPTEIKIFFFLFLIDKSEVVEETNMEDNKSMTVKKTVKSGITFGSALAMVISYTTWKSVGWAIFHGLLSWVYVIYFFLRY